MIRSIGQRITISLVLLGLCSGLCSIFSGCAGHVRDGQCTIIDFSAPQTSGKEVGIGDTALGGNSVAQSFYLASKTTISAVEVALFQVGNIPTPDAQSIQLRIEGTNTGADQPNGTLPASNALGSILVSNIGTSVGFYKVVFDGSVTLNPGIYWIRLTATYPASATDFVKWAAHDGAGGYADGQAAYFNGSAWVTTAIGGLRDMLFRLDC